MKRIFKSFLFVYLSFTMLLFGVPVESFLLYVKDQNIIDALYRADHNINVIDASLRDILKPEIKEAQAAGDTDALMVYDVLSGTSTVQYRLWDGSAWGSPATTSEMYGTEVRHMQIRYAPNRDEAVLVALTNTGQVQAQIFNGTSWSTTTVLSTLNDANGSPEGGSLYRGFDVEYEQSSGDAIVVAGDGSADPNYYVWNGTSWSSGVDINVPTGGRPYFIELAAPVATTTNDTLAMILVDSATDVYGMRWTGSAWDNMGTSAVWDASASIATEKSVDVAFERVSGDIMFMWGDSVSTDQYYRTYSGTTLSAATLLDNPQAAGVCNWIKLTPNVASSTSDQILYGVMDAGVNINTFMWSGTAWSSVHTEHATTAENADAEMDFDIVFETHSSNTDDAWLLWNNGTTISRKLWNGATQSWGTATTMGDDNNSIILNAHPNNGAVLALAYEDDTSATDDIREAHLTSGSQTWSGIAQIWEGPVRRNLAGMIRIAQGTQSYNSSNEAMMAYITEDSTSYPQYREWTGSSWGSQASTTPVNGEIRQMVLKTAPTRDEAILVTLGNNGRVEAQVWNGTSSSWGIAELISTMNNANGDRDLQSLYRGFDIEYENVSGDAILVTGDGTADPNYHVWDGSTWTSGVDINVPTGGRPNWIELASRPGSDEMAMIIQDSSTDVYGMRWTGSAWDNMGDGAVWDATAAIATEKDIDVAFEPASGDILFMWGDSVSTDQYYRTYSASTLSTATLLDNAQAGGVNNWMKLATNPASSTSDQIMYGVLDAGSDLNTFMWSGSAWSGVHTEHSGAAESNASMIFDIAFETHSSNMDDAWLVYGNGTTLSRKLWDGPTQAWQAGTTQGDDTDYVALNAHPNSGAMLMAAYESSGSASDDITQNSLTSGSQTWGTASAMWAGPVRRTALPLTLVAVAAERYIEPTITQSGYRVFANTDSTDVGSPLAALNTTTTLTAASSTFRVRTLLHTADGPILPSNKTFKLQFVDPGSGTCSAPSGGSPSAYTDVSASTAIAYNNNATPSDGVALTANANDPTHSGHSIVNQTYEEANNFTNSQGQIAVGADGMWDLSLIDYGGIPGSTYCLRIVESDGTVLDGYNQYPAIVTYMGAGNSAPTITSATDSPDPVPAGATVYFNVDWNDTDSDYAKIFVCKTNSISGTPSCSGGEWCSSVLTNRDPESCYYQTSLTEASTTPYNYYTFVCDDQNACSVSTAGTFTVSEQEPTAPTELLTQDMPSAINVGTVTPYFSAIFNDPNIGDVANKYCIQVNTLSNFTGSNLWYSDGASCSSGTAMATTTQGARSPDITYAGTALNLNLATYYWRIWFWDQNGTQSATSSVTQFTMASGTENVPQGVRLKGGVIKGNRLK